MYKVLATIYNKSFYKDHLKNEVVEVFVDRWSLYRGALISLRWSMDQPAVVTMDRWSV